MRSSKQQRGVGLLAGVVIFGLAGTAGAEGPSITGFVDTAYNYNFNKQSYNDLRGFDAQANSITLQNAEIDFEGKVSDRVGYRIDLMYGYDATLTKSAGFSSAETTITGSTNPAETTTQLQFDVQQAYATFPCPLTDATFTLGKFVTPFGAEVIEAKDNYNTSRGFLFNYAIPFTHTGLKWDKGFSDGKYAATLGITNGWDNMSDNNTGKTFIAQAATIVLPKTKVVLGGAYGPEQSTSVPSIEKNGRALVDAIVTVTPTDKLTLVANYDYGVEEGVAGFPMGDNTTANWAGIGIHANYALTDMFSVAARYENMDDEGSRTGTEQVLHSGTVTLQAKKDSVTYRLEYRQDQSTQDVFVDSDGMAADTQDTVGVQVVFAF